jgi:preprotein translocase subunit YajC
MFLTLLAQESSKKSSSSPLLSLAPFILIAVAMYFLLIRPQRKRMQDQRALANAVEEGDEVMTTSGVYGFVTAIEGDVIWLEIAEGVDIRIARQAVARRVPATEGAGVPDAAASPAAADDGAGDGPGDERDEAPPRGEQDAQ